MRLIIPPVRLSYKHILLIFLAATPCAALSIDKLVVFATDSSVKIVVALSSDQRENDLEIRASIPAIWEGSLGKMRISKGKPLEFEYSFDALKPKLWSPISPTLYPLAVTAGRGGEVLVSKTVRIGFRSFSSMDGRLLLNGKPIFLRGLAINPPGRSIPRNVCDTRAFAQSYVKCLRNHNINIIRLEHDSQIWFDVCDEEGMMVYQGFYGAPPGGEGKQSPPDNLEASLAEYRKRFETYASHPSIVIYVLSNELPYTGQDGEAWHAFLTRAHQRLRQWDATRPYIGNAGYGQGREGDINDIHRYWGWYYDSFLTYYNLRDRSLLGDVAKNQPLTFSECVGCFTGPLGQFNRVFHKQLAPQLEWTGHDPDQRESALKYQAFMLKQAIESFRRLRPINPRLCGLMPFTIPFFNWAGIESFDQMQPKPAMEQMAISYQPVLLSWESWTPQVYAGAKAQLIAHVINDAEDGSELTDGFLEYDVRDARQQTVITGRVQLPAVPHYGTWRHRVDLSLHDQLPTGDCQIRGTVRSHGHEVSRNQIDLFIAGRSWAKEPPAGQITVFDPTGKVAPALAKLKIRCRVLNDPAALKEFIQGGGHVLCMDEATWLPAQIQRLSGSANDPTYPVNLRPTADGMFINIERPLHPVFAGLERKRLALWSDYTSWDQTISGFPQVCPVTHGFKLIDAKDLSRTAILADYDRGLEGIALCEIFEGKGSVIVCGFDLVNHIGLDPAADRLAVNLANYLLSPDHELHPLVTKPIVWGDYATECGVLTGPLNGLIYNCRWTASSTNHHSSPLPDNTGSWNNRPGDQFISLGVRPAGPFTYSAGATPRDLDPENKVGSGAFYASLPPDRREMLTKVENPTSSAVALTVQINGRLQRADIPPGQTITIRNTLPIDKKQVEVRYIGDKRLVILETRFK